MKKSKFLTAILSFLPGTGHLYLGLPKRGIQLMLSFLMLIFIQGFLNINGFFIFIPVIWFYSFFDALHKCDAEFPVDNGIFSEQWLDGNNYMLKNGNRIFGFVLVGFGALVILKNILIPALNVSYEVERYIDTAIVATILIYFGIKLLQGSTAYSETPNMVQPIIETSLEPRTNGDDK
jgi:hypothetical protein